MPNEKKKKRICKVCPKKKPWSPPSEPVLVGEEMMLEENEEEEEEASVEEEERYPCEEGESPKEVVTAGFVLDEIIQGKRKQYLPFFCSTAPRSRYQNIIPVDIINDNQIKAARKKTIIDHLGSLTVKSEPFCKRLTTIIGTIGPACTEVNEILDLMEAGMNIARINMAYGDRCCQMNAIQNFQEAVKIFHGKIGFDYPVGLMMDLKGPEIRTGRICPLYACDPENPEILIEKGSVVKLTTEVSFMDKCTPNLIYIDCALVPQYVRPGMTIYIDDGAIELYVQNVKETEVIVSVEIEGYLRNYRPVHIPMVPLPIPSITDIDAEDIQLAVEKNFDFIAVSKLYSAEVITSLKGKLFEVLLTEKKLREKPIMVLAKISNFQAIENLSEIISAADGIIIQRGDLGLELPPEKILVAQKEIIGKCNLANKPVICSTQLLSSMTKRLTVAPSHVIDVAACLDDGADAVCLTKETAVGYYPRDAIEQLHHILREAEAANSKKYHFKELLEKLQPPIEPIVGIGMGACIVAEKVGASALIVLTSTGKAARIISWFRPRCPVLAVTRYRRTSHQLHLWKSICPLLYSGPCIKDNWFEFLDVQFQFAIAFGMEIGFIKAGDPLVLVSGYGKTSSFTNFLRVVYASTEPGVFLQHPKEFYDNIYIQKACKRVPEPCVPSR